MLIVEVKVVEIVLDIVDGAMLVVKVLVVEMYVLVELVLGVYVIVLVVVEVIKVFVEVVADGLEIAVVVVESSAVKIIMRKLNLDKELFSRIYLLRTFLFLNVSDYSNNVII